MCCRRRISFSVCSEPLKQQHWRLRAAHHQHFLPAHPLQHGHSQLVTTSQLHWGELGMPLTHCRSYGPGCSGNCLVYHRQAWGKRTWCESGPDRSWLGRGAPHSQLASALHCAKNKRNTPCKIHHPIQIPSMWCILRGVFLLFFAQCDRGEEAGRKRS
jgi:hypothetical protein